MWAMILSLILFSIQSAPADELRFCGRYAVEGVVRIIKPSQDVKNLHSQNMAIVLKEGTRSSYRLYLNPSDQVKAAAYVGYPVSALIDLKEKFDGTDGKVSQLIEGPSMRIPDPLRDDASSGFELKKKMKCQMGSQP